MARSTTRQQKRKRGELATKSYEEPDGAAERLPPAKKAKESVNKLKHKTGDALNGKKDEKMEVDMSVEKVDVWIGATDANKIGLYYGTAADERNWTGVPELESESTSLENACVWAAIQAIDRCGSDAKPVFIYTDCSGLCTSDENCNSLREKLNEKIKQRSGSTVILHTLATTSSQLQEAQELVVVSVKQQQNEKTTAEEEERKDDEKQTAVSDGAVQESSEKLEKDTVSLQVSEATAEVVVPDNTQKMLQQSNDGVAADDGDHGKEDAPADGPAPAAAWKPTGGLARNLLEILMSPFVRKTRTH